MTELLIVFILVIILIQDFKSRSLSWPLLPALFITSAILSVSENSIVDTGINFMQNLLLLCLLFLFVFLYTSLKAKKITNFIDKSVGLGDILFLPSVALLFQPFGFLAAFLVTSVLMILISLLIYGNKAFRVEIPYAGGWAGVLILLFVIKQTVKFNLFTDDIYLTLLNEY